MTTILTAQTWMVECKLQAKFSLFLPTYSDSVLTDIEQHPDKLFSAMNTARNILKKLQREKVINMQENPFADVSFRNLKVIYHASEVDLQNVDETLCSYESILFGDTTYKLLQRINH